MGKFLACDELSAAIKKIAGGENVRIASAFWGNGAKEDLGIDRTAKIICDVSMGGTNPSELKKLGAPKNRNLRAYPSLHAKVFLSSRGGVVCSANASHNGIGFFSDRRKLEEAGVLFPAKSEEWEAATKWFEDIFNSKICFQVDDATISLAKENWNRRRKGDGTPITTSGFDIDSAIMNTPLVLEGWGFVFTSENLDQPQIDEVAQQFNIDPAGRDFFANWGLAAKFPPKFINIHKTEDNLNVTLHQTETASRTVTNIPDVSDVAVTSVLKYQGQMPRRTKELTKAGGYSNFREVFKDLKGAGAIFQTAKELKDKIEHLRKTNRKP